MFQLAPEGRQRISENDVVSTLLQSRGATNVKARLRTVDSLTGGTTRRLESAQRNARRPGRSATRTSGPRQDGAPACMTLYTSEQGACTVCALGPATSEGLSLIHI